ncbi:tripartite motif-containing protein 16-like isoform X2 [Kryptolebias marmoratus]|uniref:tripartite motif-containing protein 16-like isoform X2 n=1 Tax=Kryptolebias marmoratus TaxID=37003 RepID=UPI0007F93C84|nr:tripartite motif-containing protein 16-like isoform X2 [Kryptolebias marmoratus]
MATFSINTEENLKENQHHDNTEAELEGHAIQLPNTQREVLCDSCMDSPSKALKSCLTCLVSYCGAHLRPHLEKDKFQTHRLVDPLYEIDCRACEVHRLPLTSFCLQDGCCVCLDCESEEHEGHQTKTLEAARTQIETELQKKHKEISQNISGVEKTIEKLQSNGDLIKFSAQEVCALVEEQFSRLQATVEEARKRVEQLLEGEQDLARRQTEGIQAHLEQRRAKLVDTLAKIDKLSESKSDADFLKGYSEWEKGVADVCMPAVHVNRRDYLHSYGQAVADVTQELCDLVLHSYSERMSMMCKNGPQPSPLPDPETREDFLKHTKSLTFDPDTTHLFLRRTEDDRKLTNTSPWQHSYPDHPSRFEFWRQAMSSESLYLGRHYIEAELSGEGAHIGVAYRSIDRKGQQSSSCITGNDYSWCVGRDSWGFSAWHAGEVTALEANPDITRIGLYLDFDRGSVSFYSVTDPMKLLHTYITNFIEPLYVTVWLSKNGNVVSLV